MTTNLLHIEKPSKELLDFVRGLRVKKEDDKKKLTAQKSKYFSKK